MTLQTTELINDMDSYDPTELRGYEVKLQYLDRLIQVYKPYADLLKENIVFRVANPEIYDQLSGKERVLVDRTQSLMQLIVAKVMYDLKKASVLTDKDVSILKDHIILSYQPGCEKFFGRYQVTVVYDDKGIVLDKRIDNLQLKVNMCTNFFIIKEFPFYFQKIVTHELGHHVYYFIDPNVESFEGICRLRDDRQNGRCTQDDFVSDYSVTLATEDYAETFMHWFLKFVTGEGATPRLQSKINHFKRLFPTAKLVP